MSWIRTSTLAIALAGLTFAAVPTDAAAGPSERRQGRQVKRIEHGARSGELTRTEGRRLAREQRHVERAQRRARSDGEVGPREAQRLDRLQDRSSRHIYRAKHNDRTPGDE